MIPPASQGRLPAAALCVLARSLDPCASGRADLIRVAPPATHVTPCNAKRGLQPKLGLRSIRSSRPRASVPSHQATIRLFWLNANAFMKVCAKPECLRNEQSQISTKPSSGQLVEQRLSLLQIARVKPFGEPAVDRSEKLASLIPLALIAPEPCHAHGGAQF